jgi:cyclic pyranopterin phosphate synthase
MLKDTFNRPIEYLRLSVTDRCDLRCSYCLPRGYREFDDSDNELDNDELCRVVSAFGALGVSCVRITGGEPLLRKNLVELTSSLKQLPGINDLSLSTNAVRLANCAGDLRNAGIQRINVSLDTLQGERFKAISGGKLHKVMAGLMSARDAGFDPIKINMVVMNGINDDEVDDMVAFCIEHGFTLRFIETMPMGDTGRSASRQYVNLQDIKAQLAKRYELIPGVVPGGGPARYVQVAGTELRIGFITPMSQHFCETCNRVRLSASGTLYLCLGQEDKLELRPLLRQGISDDGLQQAIIEAIRRKPERHEFREHPGHLVRFMSHTGG